VRQEFRIVSAAMRMPSRISLISPRSARSPVAEYALDDLKDVVNGFVPTQVGRSVGYGLDGLAAPADRGFGLRILPQDPE